MIRLVDSRSASRILRFRSRDFSPGRLRDFSDKPAHMQTIKPRSFLWCCLQMTIPLVFGTVLRTNGLHTLVLENTHQESDYTRVMGKGESEGIAPMC